MSEHGLRLGDGGAVIIRHNSKSSGEVTVRAISPVEVMTNVYCESDEELLVMQELLAAALTAVKFFIEKKNLRRLIHERIEELKDMDEAAGRDDPPAPSIGDIPF